MNLRKLSLITAMAGITTLGVVGCSSNIDDFTKVSGTAIDDYLQNAIVCVDTTKDGSCSDENASTTDLGGDFSTVVLKTRSSSPVIVEITSTTTQSATKGQLDDKAPKPPVTVLKAPAGSTVVTPLTTLVQVALDQGLYTDLASAKAGVATLLGLTGTDLTTLDYVASASKTTTGTSVLAIARAVAITIKAITDSVIANGTSDKQVALETAIALLLDSSAANKGTKLANIISNPTSFTDSSKVTAPPAAVITAVATTVAKNVANNKAVVPPAPTPAVTGVTGGSN